MELSDELLEQIGAYLSGQLSDEGKNRFEARLAADADFRQEVAVQREIRQGLQFLAQKDRFRQMHTDLDQRGLLAGSETQPGESAGETKILPLPVQPTMVRQRFRLGWLAAASVVILLGLGWLFYQNPFREQTLSQNDPLFRSFFSADLKSEPRTSTDPDRAAAPSDNGSSKQDSIRLKAAVETLQRGELPSAIDSLTVITNGQPGHWSASARWYLALARLRNNQNAEARSILRDIARLNGHPYQSEARRLLNQLPEKVNQP